MTQGVLQRQIGLCHCFQVFQEGIGGLPEGKCREGALRRIHHAGFGKDLNGTVDLEITSGDHTIAFLETSFNKVVVSGPGAQGDVAPFVDAISHVQIDNGSFSRDQWRAGWNDQRRGVLSGLGITQGLGADQIHAADVTGAGFILDDLRMHGTDPFSCKSGIHDLASFGDPRTNNGAHEHVRFELGLGVGQVDTHSDRASACIEHGIDKGNLSREGLSGKGLTGESDGLAVMQPRKIRFIGFELDPKVGEIGNRVNFRTGLDIHAFDGILVHNDPLNRRIEGDVVFGRSAFEDG